MAMAPSKLQMPRCMRAVAVCLLLTGLGSGASSAQNEQPAAAAAKPAGARAAAVAAPIGMAPMAGPEAEARVEIELPDGKLSGAATSNGWRFLGVPFAQPPIGSLRWQPPQQVAKWVRVAYFTAATQPHFTASQLVDRCRQGGVRAATAYATSCVQPKNAFVDVSKMSEDCLYLDV